MSDEKSNPPTESQPSVKERLWGDAHNDLTDVSHDEDIREFDNPIPRWWKTTFMCTALFAVPYMMFYHSGGNRSAVELYSVAAAENARLQFAEIGELAGDEATLVKYSNDRSWAAVGKGVFQANCGACHARDGGGKVGPNLCDDNYKNVKSIEDIYKVIANGAAAGAMPAWKKRLEQNELVLVASYVASLRGSSPATAKSPEGAQIPAWPEYVPEAEKPADEDDAAEA